MARAKNTPENPKRIERHFGRFGEITEYLRSFPNKATDVQRASGSEYAGSHASKFTQTDTIEEALDLFEVGWPDGLIEMGGMIEDMERILLERVPAPQVMRDMTGSDVDIGAFLSGDPENMLEWKAEPIPTEGVKIVVNCTASANVPAQTIMGRGAAIVSMIHALQMMKIPADLHLAWSVNGYGNNTWEAVLHASKPGREADLERLAFAIAHPSMLRRIVFALMEREPTKTIRKNIGVGAGYGWPRDVKTKDATLSLPMMMGGDPRWERPQAAVTWILEEFERMGIELEEA